MRERRVQARGALIGWRRRRTTNGCMLVLQIAASQAAYHDRDFQLAEISMNERQLRSLARDLVRAINARDVPLSAARPWWKFWLRRDTELRSAFWVESGGPA